MKKKKIISFDSTSGKIAAAVTLAAAVTDSAACAVLAAHGYIPAAVFMGGLAAATAYLSAVNANFNVKALIDRGISFITPGNKTNEKENNNINSL